MKKIVLICSLVLALFIGLSWYQYFQFHDGKLHVIFCDVGQGDGILIKTPDAKVFLIDGGPDDSVISCLGRHLPFWKRDITTIFLTHPHGDHFFGLFAVLERFTVTSFASIPLVNTSTSHQELVKTLSAKHIPQHNVTVDDIWQSGKVVLRVVGPSESYLTQVAPDGTINTCDACPSLAMELHYGAFTLLFTGDSEDLELAEIVKELSSHIDVLQIPHHGSATGINQAVLEEINPRLAIISVGRENRYDHPHPTILNLLSSSKIPIARTDLMGDVEVVSDGEVWWVEK